MTYSKKYKIFCIFIALILVTACSASLKGVQELVEQNLYDQAVDNYNLLLAEEKVLLDISIIKNQRLKYEKMLINDILQLTEKEAFIEADKKVDEGVRNIPSSKQLTSAIAKSIQFKELYAKKYQAMYDFEYAKYLIKERPILEQLKKVKADDNSFNALYKSRSKDRLIYSEIMGQQGLGAIEKKHPDNIRTLLVVAQRLNDDDRWRNALNTIKIKENLDKAQNELEAEEKKQQQQWQLMEKIKQLKVDFDNDFKKDGLLASQSHLKEIKSLDNVDIKWLQNSQKKLKKAIDKKLADALIIGQHYYSKGDIAVAIKIWKRALLFSPTDKRLNENIERAERFEEKLEQLTQPD